MAKYLSKDQKATLAHHGELAFRGSKSMGKHIVSSSCAMLEIRGRIVTLDKPTIKTSFYWGEHGHDYDAVLYHAQQMSKNEMFFIMENLERAGISRQLEWVRDALDPDTPGVMELVEKSYINQPDDCLLSSLQYWPNPERSVDLRPMDQARIAAEKLNRGELEMLEAALLEQIGHFETRLFTYLKRYGLEKCSFDIYWADR